MAAVAANVSRVPACSPARGPPSVTSYEDSKTCNEMQNGAAVCSDLHEFRIEKRIHPNLWCLLASVLVHVSGEEKKIPLQAWTGHEGSRRFRLPDFKIIGKRRW
jgi:hypothetical protein